MDEVDFLLNEPTVRVIICMVSSLMVFKQNYIEFAKSAKELGKVIFIISEGDKGTYETNQQTEEYLSQFPIALGRDILVGAAVGKTRHILGYVFNLNNIVFSM